MEQLSSSFFFLNLFVFVFIFISVFVISATTTTTTAEDDHNHGKPSSIVFATLGRSNYAFDIFTLPISTQNPPQNEVQITDGQSINFNGFFAPPTSSSLLSILSNQSLLNPQTPPSSSLQLLLYITERDGSSNVYLDAFHHDTEIRPSGGRRLILEIQSRIQTPFNEILIARSYKPRASAKCPILYCSLPAFFTSSGSELINARLILDDSLESLPPPSSSSSLCKHHHLSHVFPSSFSSSNRKFYSVLC